MKNKIRFIETSLYYNKHINCQSAGSSLLKHHWTSGIKLGHWDQCWQAIWNSWEFQTGKERENAAKSYSCLCLAGSNSLPLPFRTPATEASLCPASDLIKQVFYTLRQQKPNITKRKKTLPRRKEKLNVTRSRSKFALFRVITNEKKAWEQSKYSIHGYPKSFVPGTKFSSLRPHIGPCPVNITVMTVKVIHKCNLGKEYSKTRH